MCFLFIGLNKLKAIIYIWKANTINQKDLNAVLDNGNGERKNKQKKCTYAFVPPSPKKIKKKLKKKNFEKKMKTKYLKKHQKKNIHFRY